MQKSKLIGSAETMRELRYYREKGLQNQFRKSMNSELEPILKPIEGEINSTVTSSLRNRMRGMFHDGRTGWSGVEIKVKTSLRPNDLIFIEGKGRNAGLDTQVGFEYAELAGINRRPPRPVSKGWGSNSVGYHSYIYAGQGKVFSERLTQTYGRPGRFLWKRVMNRKKMIEYKVLKVAELYNIKVSRKLATEVGETRMRVN